MKVIYFSKSFFADCDFPLIRELQRKGVDVRYYIPVVKGFKSSSIIELNTPLNKWGIYKASKIKDMQVYSDCIDLDRLYFIGGYKVSRRNPFSWLLWIVAMLHILFQRADIIHITWQLGIFENMLLHLPFRGLKVMTVHDPIQHSGTKDEYINEKRRVESFRWADRLILLNQQQLEAFCEKYSISREKISLSHLGLYDSILHFKVSESPMRKPYIMFFGQINPNKGLEYLVEAMVKVHELHPNVTLLIAGKGDIYFNIEPYKGLDYIVWENRFIGIKELVSYVRGSSFCICPYKDATQSGVVQTALALSTPIIASDVGNMADVIQNDKYGLIVPPRDASSLTRAICRLLEDKSLLDKMRNCIQKELLSTTNWRQIAQDYINIYKMKR